MSLIFKQFEHKCTTVPETFPPKKHKEGCCYRLKRFWYSFILVSTKNSLTIQYFSSEYQVRNEKRRQYYSSSYFIIHPLSKLAALYDAYLCFFYCHAIFFKMVDVAFIRRMLINTGKYNAAIYFINTIDVLSWFNLIFMCFKGVIVQKQKLILIDFHGIIYYRIRSLLFWAELMSSVPKYMICSTVEACSFYLWILFTILRLFILFLCYKPVALLSQILGYLRIESRPVVIILHLSYLMAFVTHVMACTGFAISHYRHSITGKFGNNTWILYKGIIDKDISTQYSYSFFKASAQIFGVTIDEFHDNVNWEEGILSVINYGIGRIIFIVMWVTLLHVLLAKNLQDTRFQEIITQLRNWMENKELPSNLQVRVVDYYNFYYRKQFFSKKQVHKVLPESLGTKVKVNMYKTLKESNISLFSRLSENEIQSIGDHFVTEVYSPNDIIIYSGTRGKALYLLASGSVAIYSHSGKEVCHLHDGAYFGELSLMIRDQKVTATIIAIETTKVYRIARQYFEKYILSKKELREMFLIQAENRLQAIMRVEDEYRRILFAEMYKK